MDSAFPEERGAVSGSGAGVPRLAKWLTSCTVVASYSSYADFHRQASTAGVASALPAGGAQQGTSCRAAAKMITCLVAPLRSVDQLVLRDAKATSI
eukprot:7563321-Lingulodinium_polyedra.AAC.1